MTISKSIIFAGVLFCCLSLACSSATGSQPEKHLVPTSEPVDIKPTDTQHQGHAGAEGNACSQAEFLSPKDANIFFDFGDEYCTIQTNLSYDELRAFYRNAYSSRGYTEIECNPAPNPALSDEGICINFDKGNKEIIIGAIIDPNTNLINVTIRFQK